MQPAKFMGCPGMANAMMIMMMLVARRRRRQQMKARRCLPQWSRGDHRHGSDVRRRRPAVRGRAAAGGHGRVLMAL
jgi:hypothetical protein